MSVIDMSRLDNKDLTENRNSGEINNHHTLEKKDTLDKIMDEVIEEKPRNSFTTASEWDNTVVPSVENPPVPPAEAFIIPIDEPDGKGKKLNATPGEKFQANTFAAKKTVAQGMMDIALITANANQLRYIVEYNYMSKTYYLNLVLIVISLILQVCVGLSLIFKGKYDMRGQSKHLNARRINNCVVVGVFMITIINVFIASFTITSDTAAASLITTQVAALPQPANSVPNP